MCSTLASYTLTGEIVLSNRVVYKGSQLIYIYFFAALTFYIGFIFQFTDMWFLLVQWASVNGEIQLILSWLCLVRESFWRPSIGIFDLFYLQWSLLFTISSYENWNKILWTLQGGTRFSYRQIFSNGCERHRTSPSFLNLRLGLNGPSQTWFRVLRRMVCTSAIPSIYCYHGIWDYDGRP